MIIDFTNLALAIIGLFGLFGFVRGIKRLTFATGGIFFAMAVVEIIGAPFLADLPKLVPGFRATTLTDLFLAILFVFTVYVVQLVGVKLILDQRARPAGRQERISGAILGLINGFLILANAMRYANPFLISTQDPATGGWTLHLLLPYFNSPDAGSINFGMEATTIEVQQSAMLRIYDSLPTALVFLFAFLLFVFVGTVYGRVMSGRR